MQFIMLQNRKEVQMNNDFATNQEIEYASSILLPDTHCFLQDPEKEEILKCNESKDITACPGSGKTTTLLAKLLILANKMPLQENKGICVLTHTNVAINEIKDKLGNKSDILFRYPNHFGTIQSFVDKFLAIPYLNLKYSTKVSRIDIEKYNKEVHSYYLSLNFGDESNGKLRNYLYQQGTPKEIAGKLPGKIKDQNANNLLANLIININGGDILRSINGSKFLSSKPSSKAASLKYNELIRFKKDITQKGIITFDDAYLFASNYLTDFQQLPKAISNRFKYVFIDEMQDTDKHQLNLLDKIFDKKKCVIQRFGDPHQSIYSNVRTEKVWKPENPMPINSSKRFGENVASVLRTVCIEDNKVLQASKDIQSLCPVMIIFKEPKEVIPKFCELLTTRKTDYYGKELSIWDISIKENRPVKAIGWIGKEDKIKPQERYDIQSYFENYQKELKKSKVSYSSLKSFLKKEDGAKAKRYTDMILEAILHILRVGDVTFELDGKPRSYSKTSFIDALIAKDIYKDFRKKLAIWSKKMHEAEAYCEEVLNELRNFLNNTVSTEFNVDMTKPEINSFISNETDKNSFSEDDLKANNFYTWDKNPDIKVEVSNIHQVKGETHTATCYLETSYYPQGEKLGMESERIKDQLGRTAYNNNDPTKEQRVKETLKMAYVGMSRPRYFLCMAIHRDRFDKCFDIKNGGLWEVVNA